MSDFGQRSEDIIRLDELFKEGKKAPDEDAYTVAVVGDSFVWGMGVKFEETLTPQLEKLLTQNRKTRVLSLGLPKDSIIDYAQRYIKVREVYPVNLYVFVLVENDLVMRSPEDDIEGKDIVKGCKEEFPQDRLIYADESDPLENIKQSFQSQVNLCIFEKTLEFLPQENALYFLTNTFPDLETLDTFKSYLEKTNKKYILAEASKEIPEYKKYWQNPPKYLFVSQAEMHPSSLAHKIYADLIYREILQRREFGFNN